MTAQPEMTADWHEAEAHRLLAVSRLGGVDPAVQAADALAHATLAVALRLGPSPEERRQAAARLRADEEARSVVLLIDRADTHQARQDVEGEWPEAVADALDRGWLIWLQEPARPKTLQVTLAGRAMVDGMAGS